MESHGGLFRTFRLIMMMPVCVCVCVGVCVRMRLCVCVCVCVFPYINIILFRIQNRDLAKRDILSYSVTSEMLLNIIKHLMNIL